MPKIFISYRREDSEHITGRIDDRLWPHFGRANVFLDIDTIPFGVDFREHLGQAVGRCDILLAVIGKHWLDVRHGDGLRVGERRLDDPADFVRIEIHSALTRGIPVIPVLVDGARMPNEQELPLALRDLAYRNATEVRSGRDFNDHVGRLIRGIERLLSGRQESGAQERQQNGPLSRNKGSIANEKIIGIDLGTTNSVAAPVARVVITESVWTRETVPPPPARRETLREAPAAVAPVRRETPAKSWKKWLIGAGAGVALLLAGLVVLGAGGVFKVKTADGVLVVQVNEPNPEVYVDGEHVTVSWDDGGKKAEVRVRPGTRKVEVKKDGFTAFGEEVTLEDGGRQPLTAHLEKIPSSNPALKDEAKRAKRMLRWAMKFNTRDGDDYLRQLTGLGAIVAIPHGPDQFAVADLTQKPLRFEQKGLADLPKRIWWTDSNAGSIQGLAQAMGYGGRAPAVITYLPEKLEQELAQKELAYNNVPEDQINETTFEVELTGGGYNLRVFAQTRK